MDTSEDATAESGQEKVVKLSKGKRKLHPGLAEPLGSKRSRGDGAGGSERRAERIKFDIFSFGYNSHEGTRVQEYKRLVEQLKRDEAEHADIIASGILQAVEGFPTRLTTYAALVGWLNLSSFEVVDLLVKKIGVHLELDASYTQKKLLLRFLVELSKLSIVSTDAVLDFMEKLCTEKTVAFVLENIPWLSIPLRNAKPERLAAFVEKLKVGIAAVRAKLPPLEEIPFPIRPEESSQTNTVLRIDFYENMCNELLDSNKARIELVEELQRTIYSPYDELRGASDQSMIDQTEHTLESVQALEAVEFTDGPRLGEPMVQIFAPAKERFEAKIRSKNPDLPLSSIELAHHAVEAFTPVDRFVLTLQCDEVLARYSPRYKDAARMLVELKSPSDLEHLLIEYLLGLLLALPRTRQPKLYYEAIITQLCKDRPTKYGVVMEDVIDSFMACVRQADIETVARFASWFSFHLSNFRLKWPWQKWDKMVESVEDSDPRKVFLNQLIGRTLSLCYREDLLKAITPQLATLVPEEEALVDLFDDEQANAEEKELYQQILEFVKTKPSPFKLVEWGNEHIGQIDGAKCRVIMAAMLQYGKASNTHLSAAMKRVSPLLTNESVKLEVSWMEEILSVVESCWRNAPLKICFAFKELVNANVVKFPVVLRRCLKAITLQSWWIYDFIDESLTIRDGEDLDETTEILDVFRDHLESPYVDVLIRKHSQLLKA